MRALESRKRVDAEVVIEKGALSAGRALLYRDFLKGKIYVAHPIPPTVEKVDPANWETKTLALFLDEIVGLPEAFEKPGDRHAILEEGRVTWSN